MSGRSGRLVSLLIGVLVSPGLPWRVPRYEVAEYTAGAVRAPYDFTVMDTGATTREREEARRSAPLVARLDDRVAPAIGSRLTDAFAAMERAFEEADQKGQFDDCPLTLRDLNRVREAMVEVLVGMHHRRVRYPDQKPL